LKAFPSSVPPSTGKFKWQKASIFLIDWSKLQRPGNLDSPHQDLQLLDTKLYWD